MIEQAGANLKNYRTAIGYAARANRATPTSSPVAIRVEFTFERPRKHYHANGLVKENAPEYAYPCKRGDVDKLSRAVLDALTGVWYTDDAQVVELAAVVRFADYASTWVEMREIAAA